MECLCRVHIKNDEEDRQLGNEPLKCVGHGGLCPCSEIKNETPEPNPDIQTP